MKGETMILGLIFRVMMPMITNDFADADA